MKFYLLITLVAVTLYFMLKPAGEVESFDQSTNAIENEVLAVKEDRSEKSQEEPLAPPTARPLVTKTENAEQIARANMNAMLSQLAECTEIKNSLPSGNAESTLMTILDSVQSELGEPVIRSEDWNSTEIKMADNSRRLIRIETVYENDDIIKKLKYYQSTETQLIPLELTQEQKINPSESFLASLEKEGEVTAREKSERVFFQNGEEISYIEKDGKVQSSEIIRAGKSLKCSEYGQSTFRCQCF